MPDTPSGSVESTDLRTDLTAAYDANVGPAETPAPVVDAKAPAEAAKPVDTPEKPAVVREDGRDEHGRFAKKEGEVETVDTKTVETDPKAPTTDTVVIDTEAPQHWPSKDRDLFAKQPADVKAWLLDRTKSMEADYTKKTMEVAPIRRMKEELDVMLAPYRDQYRLQGLDDVGAIRQLVAAHDYLVRDPQAAIAYLAKSYGVDLTAASDPNAPQPDPQMKAIQTELAQFRSERQQEVTARQSAEQAAKLQEVTSFAEEKDSQGQPMRPYFDDVAQEIKALLSLNPGPKSRQDLQDAYDRAVYANPNTRAKVTAAENAKRQASEDAERKAKADAAKRAGYDVTGQGGLGQAEIKDESIRGALSRAWGGDARV